MNKRINIEFNVEIMKKRIEDDLFDLPSVAIHLLEKGDITGAYRIVKAMKDLKTLKNGLEELVEQSNNNQEVID